MRVRSGWSTQYARLKFDVETDEADLERVCDGWGITPALRAKLTAEQAFTILSTLAEYLAAYEATKVAGTDSEADTPEVAAQKAAAAQQAHWQAMAGIRAQFGLPDLQQASQAQAGASGGTAGS